MASESASESPSDDDVFMTDNDEDDSDEPLNPARIFIPLMGERRHQLSPLPPLTASAQPHSSDVGHMTCRSI